MECDRGNVLFEIDPVGIDTSTGEEVYNYDAGGRIASITRDGETWNLEYNTADLITQVNKCYQSTFAW